MSELVLVTLTTLGPNPVTHGVRIPYDKICNVGVLHHNGKTYRYHSSIGGNVVFNETVALDISDYPLPEGRRPKPLFNSWNLFGHQR